MLRFRNGFLLLLIITSLQSCIAFQHKKFASKTADQISKSLETLTNEDRINQLAKSAVEGAMEGTSSPTSEEALNELTKILSKNIEQELNKVFVKLDTRTPGQKFSKGVVESLVNKEVEEKLKTLLANTAKGAEQDFGLAIKELEKDINGSLNSIVRNLNNQIATLNGSLQSVLSAQLQDSLSTFLNNALADVEFKTLSHKLSTELLSPELRDSIISLATDVQNNIDITQPLPDILRSVRRNTIILGLLGFFLIAGLIYWSYFLRRKSILGDDLTEILQKLSQTEDADLINKLESFLKEKGHYDFYKKQVKVLNKKNKS